MLVSVTLSNGVNRWTERVLIADAPLGVAFGLWARKKIKEAIRKFNTERHPNQPRRKFSSKSIRILDATMPAKTRQSGEQKPEPLKQKRKGPPTPEELQAVSVRLNEAIELSRFCSAQLDSVRYKRCKGELSAKHSRKTLRNVRRCLRKTLKVVVQEIQDCAEG